MMEELEDDCQNVFIVMKNANCVLFEYVLYFCLKFIENYSYLSFTLYLTSLVHDLNILIIS